LSHISPPPASPLCPYPTRFRSLIIECQRPGKLRNASADRPLLERAAAHVIPLTVKLVSHRQRERTSIADRFVTNRDRQLRPAIHELSIRVGSRGQRKPAAGVVEVVLQDRKSTRLTSSPVTIS